MFIYGLYAIESHKYDKDINGDFKMDNILQRHRSLSIGGEYKHPSDHQKFKFQNIDTIYEKNLKKFENLVQNVKQDLDEEKHLKLSEHILNKNQDNRRSSLSFDSSINENQTKPNAQSSLQTNCQSNISKRKQFNQRQYSFDFGVDGCEKVLPRVKRNSLQQSTIFEDESENESRDNVQEFDSKSTKKWLSKIIYSFKKGHTDF